MHAQAAPTIRPLARPTPNPGRIDPATIKRLMGHVHHLAHHHHVAALIRTVEWLRDIDPAIAPDTVALAGAMLEAMCVEIDFAAHRPTPID